MVLFSAFLFLLIYFPERKKEKHWFLQFLQKEPPQNLIKILLFGSITIFLITSSIHAYRITNSFRDHFLFHDADYIGITDILQSLLSFDGYKSSYYSEGGRSSFLDHHFSPGIFLLSPFIYLIPSKMGLAVASFFFYQLATILWLGWAYSEYKQNPKTRFWPFSLFWVAILNQMYLYRIGSSYHFETLIPFFAFFFFYLYEKNVNRVLDSFSTKEISKPSQNKIFLVLVLTLYLTLSVKEDLAIYLILFFVPLIIFSFRKKNPILNLQLKLLLFLIVWMLITFLVYPLLTDKNLGIHWTGELTKTYHTDLKQINNNLQSFKIFVEVLVSGGTAIITNTGETIGIVLIYLIHFFSNRPWHHEMYSYYSYTLIPMVLYSGVILIKRFEEKRSSFLFLCFMLLFYKNSLDANFPLSVDKIESSVLPEKKEYFLMFSEDLKHIPSKIIDTKLIYSQYNLSIFLPDHIRTKPLGTLHSDCPMTKTNCYLLIAPDLTDEVLWPKERIIAIRNSFEKLGGQKIFQGKIVELWSLGN